MPLRRAFRKTYKRKRFNRVKRSLTSKVLVHTHTLKWIYAVDTAIASPTIALLFGVDPRHHFAGSGTQWMAAKFATLRSLYDQYKVLSASVRWVPSYNINSVAALSVTSDSGLLGMYYDTQQDGITGNMNDVQNSPNHKMGNMLKPMFYKIPISTLTTSKGRDDAVYGDTSFPNETNANGYVDVNLTATAGSAITHPWGYMKIFFNVVPNAVNNCRLGHFIFSYSVSFRGIQFNVSGQDPVI